MRDLNLSDFEPSDFEPRPPTAELPAPLNAVIIIMREIVPIKMTAPAPAIIPIVLCFSIISLGMGGGLGLRGSFELHILFAETTSTVPG